jgi:hypothetical protein
MTEVTPSDFAVFRVQSTRWMDDDAYRTRQQRRVLQPFRLRCKRLAHGSVIHRLAAFREEADGQLAESPAAFCRFVHVYVNRESRRPAPISDAVAEALE